MIIHKILSDRYFWSDQDRDLAGSLINLATHERINLKHDDKKEPLHISFDIINWKKNKFNEPLHNFKMPSKLLKFTLDKTQASMISSFQERFSSYADKDFYTQAVEFIRPRKFLLHTLAYDETKR